MSAQKSGHGEHHPGDDNLLHLIAKKERELETLVAASRTEAASMIERARADAEQVLAEARAKTAAASREHEELVAADVARINDELQVRAAHDVDRLRKQAAARQAQAVKLVVDRVVKGTTA